MTFKKFLTILILTLTIPCYAKENTDKFNYINMDWWKNYNDEILVEHFQTLYENNHDLKIAALKAKQAEENIGRSAWKDRMTVLCCDFRNYSSEVGFDLIVSNPPYFLDALKSPDKQRSVARHTDSLNYDLLFRHSSHLLQLHGVIAIIIPSEVEQTVEDVAWMHQLYPVRRMRVFTKPGKPCRRVMLAFSFEKRECINEELCIEQAAGGYSKEYVDLTREFYLKM